VVQSGLAAPLRAAQPDVDALGGYGVGQSYARLFQDTVLPGTCGIVLERDRCKSDLRTVQQWRGTDPTDAAYRRWLDSGDVSLKPSTWNGSYIPDKAWTEAPLFSWWYTMGVVSIAISQPRSEGADDYLAHYVGELAKHQDAAPQQYKDLILANGTPFGRAQPLQQAVDAAVPVLPYPAPTLGSGIASDARLGVYLATLQELVDSLLAVSRPESRAFASLVLRALESRHRQFSDGLSVAPLIAALQSDIPFDPEQLDKAWREPLAEKTINGKWPAATRMALLLGQVLAQVAYNAAVLKDTQSDATFRGALAQLPGWSGMSQGLRSEIAALQKLPSPASGGSWEQINSAATRATLDLVSGV